jgi:hypothetical protein
MIVLPKKNNNWEHSKPKKEKKKLQFIQYMLFKNFYVKNQIEEYYEGSIGQDKTLAHNKEVMGLNSLTNK